jgi:hypothetical protein
MIKCRIVVTCIFNSTKIFIYKLRNIELASPSIDILSDGTEKQNKFHDPQKTFSGVKIIISNSK